MNKMAVYAAAILLIVCLFLGGCISQVVDIQEVTDIVNDNNPPIFSEDLLLNGIPGDSYLTFMRYLVDLRYREASERGPWTGIIDPDGDKVTVLSVRAWMVLWGERVEDAVFFPPFDGSVHASWRAGESGFIEPAFVLYPGTGIWEVDGVLICPYPEVGYAGKTLSWYPIRSGEGCYSTYHPQTDYIIEVVATDGIDTVSHEYVLTMAASWGCR